MYNYVYVYVYCNLVDMIVDYSIYCMAWIDGISGIAVIASLDGLY
jgi:hypothetical protein